MTISVETLATLYAKAYGSLDKVDIYKEKIIRFLATDMIQSLDELGVLKAVLLLILEYLASHYCGEKLRIYLSEHFTEMEFFDNQNHLVSRNGIEHFFSLGENAPETYLIIGNSPQSDDIRCILSQEENYPPLPTYDTTCVHLTQVYRTIKKQLRSGKA